jgi:hypothetical protein
VRSGQRCVVASQLLSTGHRDQRVGSICVIIHAGCIAGTLSGIIAMLLAAVAVAIASPSTIGCCVSSGGTPAAATVSNVVRFIFSPEFFSRHNVAALFSLLAAAAIETSTDAVDNLVGL